MKLANLDREILHIIWTTWGISMKFSEKMWIRRYIFWKATAGEGGHLAKKLVAATYKTITRNL